MTPNFEISFYNRTNTCPAVNVIFTVHGLEILEIYFFRKRHIVVISVSWYSKGTTVSPCPHHNDMQLLSAPRSRPVAPFVFQTQSPEPMDNSLHVFD